ncbi:MAG TPA: hypothetical protein VJQ82_16495 [Terriglobales bacterium]|nr:hypothetical protein [Terriglobales bacterium]
MNPNLAMFAQMAQGGQQMPPGSSQMPAPMPKQPVLPQSPQGNQQLSPQILAMIMQRARQGQQPQQPRFTPQQLAAQGRFGDTTVAHLTPGEIEIPPQVQTPKLLAAINQAFRKAHVSPAQFTAGSPASSVNPKTGMPEYNFLSAILPTLLGIGGSLLAPELAPILGASANVAGAVGGGLGSFLGGKLAGESTQDALLGGALSGVGGYLGGKLFPNATIGPSASPTADMMADAASSDAARGFLGADAQSMGASAAQSAVPNSGMPSFLSGMNPGVMGGVALGGLLSSGGQRQPLPITQPGFYKKLPPLASLGTPQSLLGQQNYQGPVPLAPTGNPNNYGYGPQQNLYG